MDGNGIRRMNRRWQSRSILPLVLFACSCSVRASAIFCADKLLSTGSLNHKIEALARFELFEIQRVDLPSSVRHQLKEEAESKLGVLAHQSGRRIEELRTQVLEAKRSLLFGAPSKPIPSPIATELNQLRAKYVLHRHFGKNLGWALAAGFTEDGKRAVAISAESCLWISDLRRCTTLPKLSSSAAAISRDARIGASGYPNGSISLWDSETGTPRRLVLNAHSDRINAVNFNADASLLVSGSDDKTVAIWELPEGRFFRRFEGHELRIAAVQFSPTSEFVVSASPDGSVRCWDVENEEEVWTFEHPWLDEGESNHALAVAFSRDGKKIATGWRTGHIVILDAATGTPVQTLKKQYGWIRALAFSPDDRLLLSGTDTGAYLWSLESGQQLQILPGHGGSVSSVAFSPDGTHLITGSLDRTLALWRISTEGDFE